MIERRGPRRTAALLAAAFLLVTPSCARHASIAPDRVAGSSGAYSVYKGAFREGTTGERRFRLLLFAELPDRLHAEVLAPVGGPRMILEGGGGRFSVALVDERVAYVGDATAASLARAIGTPISLEELVRALLGEDTQALSARVAVVRRSRTTPGLPDTFELRSEGRILEIERTGTKRVRTTGPRLGSGSPPDGFELLPLSSLEVREGDSLLGEKTQP